MGIVGARARGVARPVLCMCTLRPTSVGEDGGWVGLHVSPREKAGSQTKWPASFACVSHAIPAKYGACRPSISNHLHAGGQGSRPSGGIPHDQQARQPAVDISLYCRLDRGNI